MNNSCCSPGCRHCTDTECIQCHDSLELVPLEGTDKCVCRNGFYWFGDECVACHDVVYGCFICSNGDQCLECESSLNLVIN